MIALIDDIDLDGFTIQSQDDEQMELNKTSTNSPSGWSTPMSLVIFVDRLKQSGDSGGVLQILGTVLGMSNVFTEVVISRQVMMGGHIPVRILSLKIKVPSNPKEDEE